MKKIYKMRVKLFTGQNLFHHVPNFLETEQHCLAFKEEEDSLK